MSAHPLADLDPQSKVFSQWQETQRLGADEVSFVIEAEDAAPTRDDLRAVTCFCDELASFDARARLFLHEETLEDDSVTRAYVEHHLDGLRFEVLTEIFGDTDDLEIGTFLDALRLVGVALRPRARSAVFDYSLGRELTNAVLAVSVSVDGARWSVAIASYVDEG